jgi:glutamate-1-semialdehyde 2,1-aminomutase
MTTLLHRPVYALPSTFAQSIAHQQVANDLVPGGAHTYAKGDDQYPADLCPVISRGQGANVWDVDGNRYVEFGAGCRSVTLGHGYRPVCDAAYRAMLGGTNFARPAKIEAEAAEAFLSCVPFADMVKFGKNGSDATTAAFKLARAVTGRDAIALCGDQPFFSVDDWFIGTTPMDGGITSTTKSNTLTFRYNDLAGLEKLFVENPNRIACVMLEAERDEKPLPGYLAGVKDLCRKHGALFIIDETIAGFRLALGGGQELHEIEPDLSTWGKAVANGFSVSALAGRRALMERGGLRDAGHDRVFLMSLTHGAETSGLAALIATVEAYKSRDVIARMQQIGVQIRDGFNAITEARGIREYLYAEGHPANLVYVTKDNDHAKSQLFRTLFLQEIVKRGVIAPSLVISEAFTSNDIEHALWAFEEAADVYAKALHDGVDKYLVGRPVKPVFRKRA